MSVTILLIMVKIGAPKQWTSSTTFHTSPLTEHTKDLFAKNRVVFSL